MAEGALEQSSVALNPHLQYLNSHQYGYATVHFTRDYCDYTMFVVDKSTPTPAAALVAKKFRTPAGQVLIEDVTSNVNPARRGESSHKVASAGGWRAPPRRYLPRPSGRREQKAAPQTGNGAAERTIHPKPGWTTSRGVLPPHGAGRI